MTATRTPPRVARAAASLGTHLGPGASFTAILGVGLLVLAVASSLFAGLYVAVIDDDSVALLDEPVLHLAMSLRSPALDAVAVFLTDAVGVFALPIGGVAIIVGLAIHRRRWMPVVLGLTAGAGSLLMTEAGKDLVGRARPPLVDAVPPYESTPSFPSGHTLNATVAAGIVAYLLVLGQARRSTRVLTWVVAGAVAGAVSLSRVYLGDHWLTDVLAGGVLAAAWLAVLITAHRVRVRILAERRRAAGA